jgi:hypothetical protein
MWLSFRTTISGSINNREQKLALNLDFVFSAFGKVGVEREVMCKRCRATEAVGLDVYIWCSSVTIYKI